MSTGLLQQQARGCEFGSEPEGRHPGQGWTVPPEGQSAHLGSHLYQETTGGLLACGPLEGARCSFLRRLFLPLFTLGTMDSSAPQSCGAQHPFL